MGIVRLLDELSPAIVQPAGRVWNVFARSLGEQGASGRTALAWRWALSGSCPSPVTLSAAPGWPPDRAEILAEAEATAELSKQGEDPGGQVMHARLVLQWLVGELDAVPLWNTGTDWSRTSEGAQHPHTRAEIEELYFWAGMACRRYPRPTSTNMVNESYAHGWAYGTEQLLTWICGELNTAPLTGLHTIGRPALYQVSLDVRVAMTGVLQARADGKGVIAGRMEGMMDTFLWLAGWNSLPPVDRHGHATLELCAHRQSPCCCDSLGGCVLTECQACKKDPCVHAFNLHDSTPLDGENASTNSCAHPDNY